MRKSQPKKPVGLLDSLRTLINAFRKKKDRRTIIISSSLALAICIAIPILISKEANFVGVICDLAHSLTLFFASALLIAIINYIFLPFEDKDKVRTNNDSIEEFYGKNYIKELKINDSTGNFHYESLFDICEDGANCEIEIVDSLNKFELDPLIRNHCFEILAAHENSNIGNFITLRIAGFEKYNSKVVVKTERSNYISHMLTNRAIDYQICDRISLRDLFEYNSTLSPLEKSKLSNHIGLIGMIFIENGKYTLFPQRDKTSTISKNKLTSGLAAAFRLDSNKCNSNLSHKSTTPFKEEVMERLPRAMKIIEKFDRIKDKININLVGIGRDVYEGGKPAFFYRIDVDITLNEFFELSCKCKNCTKLDQCKGGLDFNKRICVAEYSTIKVDNECKILSFNSFISKKDGKIAQKSFKLEAEKNLISNLWHLNNK